MSTRPQPYHLVTQSPWPFFVSINLTVFILGGVAYLHQIEGYRTFLISGVLTVIFTLILWWRDVIREALYEKSHTLLVQMIHRFGFALFILSEVMFFFTFFWSYFHYALAPSIQLGCTWPPIGIEPFDPLGIPALNTIILLLSAIAATWTHSEIITDSYLDANTAFECVSIFGISFLFLQFYEYSISPFDISDTVYGSIFFLTTGFHGLHVFGGFLFIVVCLIRQIAFHFTKDKHVAVEAAFWYWHFVDVVWLFLYVFVYLWSNFPEIPTPT